MVAEDITLHWRWQARVERPERVYGCCNAWRAKKHTLPHLVRVHKLTHAEAKAILGQAVAYRSTAAQRTRAGQERLDLLQTRSVAKRIMAQVWSEMLVRPDEAGDA